MERIQLAKLAVVVGAPLLILGAVDQAVNRLFFKVYGSRALTSESLRLANAVTKIVLGAAVMGAGSFLIPSYLTLGLSRTLLYKAWSINMVYLFGGIPGYVLYVMKEVESHAKACVPDRITPGNFYKNRSDFEQAKLFHEGVCRALNQPITPLPYLRTDSLGSDYRTLEVWSELATEVKIKYECFYNRETPQKYSSIPDQFNEWINQNKLSLRTLKKLDLHDVDFTNLGLRLEQFPQLENLNLTSSKRVAYFLSNNPPLLNQLKTINLAFTGLTTFPSSLVSQCPNLEELDISSNQITALPEAVKLPTTLKELDIFNNQLATFPSPASQCPNLAKLFISSNKITIFPSLVQFPNLKKFDISSNELTELPEAAHLPTTLEILAVSKNRRIRAIPDSLLQMPKKCMIEVADIFSYGIFRAFYRRISDIRMRTSSQCGVKLRGSFNDTIRTLNENSSRLSAVVIGSILAPSYADAEMSIETTLLFWLTKYQKNFSKFCENNSDRLPEAGGNQKDCPAFYKPLLYHAERGKLSLFLERLKASEDYTVGGTSQIQLTRRVYRMLELAAANLPFCEILFPLLHDACSTCHDRPALVFNRIEMQMELLTAEEKDEEALAKLCIGLKRVELLHKCAEERITTLRLPDPVEVFLCYETQLRVQLELPVSTENMIFKKYAGISDQVLQEDAKQVLAKTQSPDDIRTILLEQEVWHDRMKQIYRVSFKELENGFGLQMEELSKNTTLNDGAKDTAMIAVMTERKQASQLFVMARTTEWIANNLKGSS